MSHEYEDIENPDVIVQGDVIEWLGDSEQRPWQRYGVIVTADCDLHWGKHGGYISYVPAMDTEDYVWDQWRPAVLQGPWSQQVNTLATRINKWLAKNRPEYGNLSHDALCAWLVRVGKDTFLTELGVIDKGQRNDLGTVIDGVQTLASALERSEPDLNVLVHPSARSRVQRHRITSRS